jgi:lysozyme
MNPACIDLVKNYEGCSLKAYPDPGTGGEPITIGWGCTGGFKLGDTCTQAQADEWLLKRLEETETGVKALLHVPVTDNQLAALTSFAYNVGLGNLRGSTLLKTINAGPPGPPDSTQFLRWVYASGRILPGLVKRRQAEKSLFDTPNDLTRPV